MATQTGYPRRVARAKYTPPNDDVAARIDRVVELHRQWVEADAQHRTAYQQALAEIADPDKDDVPIAHLAGRLGLERKTVYRHLGRPMP